MAIDESRQCIANLRMNIFDFGPECKISIDNSEVLPLAGYYKDGACEPISLDFSFPYKDTGHAVSSAEVKMEIFREWGGNDRLVFTRYVRILEGDNNLIVSFYGVRNSKVHAAIFGKKAAETTVSDNINNSTV